MCRRIEYKQNNSKQQQQEKKPRAWTSTEYNSKTKAGAIGKDIAEASFDAYSALVLDRCAHINRMSWNGRNIRMKIEVWSGTKPCLRGKAKTKKKGNI